MTDFGPFDAAQFSDFAGYEGLQPATTRYGAVDHSDQIHFSGPESSNENIRNLQPTAALYPTLQTMLYPEDCLLFSQMPSTVDRSVDDDAYGVLYDNSGLPDILQHSMWNDVLPIFPHTSSREHASTLPSSTVGINLPLHDYGMGHLASAQQNTWNQTEPSSSQGYKRPIGLQVVPQQTYDPYHYLRSSSWRATEVVLHTEPRGITSKDNLRISFDLVGNTPRSGICMALLEKTYFECTRRNIIDGEQPIVIPCSRSQGTYPFIYFRIQWPTYPQISKEFKGKLSLVNAFGTRVTQAELAKEIVRRFRVFIQLAQEEQPLPGQSHLTFGRNGLALDNMWLRSLYQMSGRYFFAEVLVPTE